jgi:hypothetical protein
MNTGSWLLPSFTNYLASFKCSYLIVAVRILVLSYEVSFWTGNAILRKSWCGFVLFFFSSVQHLDRLPECNDKLETLRSRYDSRAIDEGAQIFNLVKVLILDLLILDCFPILHFNYPIDLFQVLRGQTVDRRRTEGYCSTMDSCHKSENSIFSLLRERFWRDANAWRILHSSWVSFMQRPSVFITTTWVQPNILKFQHIHTTDIKHVELDEVSFFTFCLDLSKCQVQALIRRRIFATTQTVLTRNLFSIYFWPHNPNP